MTRRATRGEPSPLVQIPVWGGDAPLEAAEDTPPDGVEELLGGLNPEQRRAVTHGDGPLLVVAGAGTGKTQVITRRIAWLIATRRAKPSEILALTFTDQAADEMQVRVDQLVPYGYTDTAISTFHAFGDRLVREFALELGLPPDVRVLSRPETVVFLRERLFELELEEYRPLGDPTRFLDALATLFSRAKDEDVSPDAYLAYADRLAAQAATAAEGGGRGSRRGGRARRGCAAPGGARPRLRPLPGAARRERVDRLRRPGLARPAAAARLARGARGRPAPLQVHPRGRVPGHEPGPGGARRAGRRAPPERDGRRRRRPVDLQVPGRRHQQHPRVPRALPPGSGRRAATELPLAGADPRRLLPPRPAQRARPPGVARRDRQAPRSRSAMATTPCPSATRPSRAAPRRRTGSPSDVARRIREGARPRDVAVLVRANAAADPILRALNLEGIPWRFSGTSGLYARPEVRLLLVVPAGDRGPVLVGGRLRAGRVRAVRARGDGPRRDREHRAPPEPVRVGRPRGAGPAARHPAALPGDPRRGDEPRRGPQALRGARQRAAGRRGAVRVPAGNGLAGEAGGRGVRRRRGGAVQCRALLRHHPRPVGAARRRPRGVRRAPPEHADPGGRRPAHGRHRPRRRRRRRDDHPQGEGPRVPVRLPAGPRDRAVPGDRPARAARRSRSSSCTRRCPRATTSSRRSDACSTSA